MVDPIVSHGVDSLKGARRDLYAFAGAFFIGLIIFFVFHALLGLGQGFVTTSILLVIIGYAVFAASVPQLRVRLDQAGDNAYYLVLLFTLTSMAFALYEFGVETRAGHSGIEQIISNFGIALASTIIGIVLRVILHQMRVDPADVESMTRIELSEASNRVRASLDTVYGDMIRFHEEVRQRTGDVVAALLKDATAAMGNLVGELAQSTQGLMESTEVNQRAALKRTSELTIALEQIANETRNAAEKLRGVEAPPLLLSKRLTRLSDVMEKLTVDLDGVVGKFATASESASSASQSMSQSADMLSVVAKAAGESHSNSTQQLNAALASVRTNLESIGKGLENDLRLFSQMQQNARSSSADAARSQAAAIEVLGRLAELTRGIASLVDRAV